MRSIDGEARRRQVLGRAVDLVEGTRRSLTRETEEACDP